MPKLNSYVIYGENGVCLITDIRKEKFAGSIKEYYILKPVSSGASTLFVPADNEALVAKMREILSPEEIKELIRTLPDDSMDWVENNRERSEMYKEVFARGDRYELLLLIKSLYAHKKERLDAGKKLWAIDDNAMQHAEKLVYEEFATVLGITPEEVVPFIKCELEQQDS